MTDPRSPITTEDEALLCALLDGELSAGDEAALLSRLDHEPALAAALDELADAIALSRNALVGGAVDDVGLGAAVAGVDFTGLAEAALASSSSSVPSSPEGAAVLTSLVVDAEATPTQVAQLTQLVQGPAADAVALFAGAVEATRAVVVAHEGVVDGLAAAAARVEADVAATERIWSLSTAAVDGVLAAADVDELVAFAGGDRGVVVQRALGAQHAGRQVGEALRAAVESPAFAALGARAGASALQVIGAEALRTASTQAPAATQAATPSTTTTLSWWSTAVAALRRGLVPLAVGAAAVVAFALVRAPSTTQPTSSTTSSATTTTNSPQAVEQAFLEIAGPKLLGGASSPVASATLLADNAADVEALDATSSTQVFETPESHITVIWVADLGDDAAPEGQGT